MKQIQVSILVLLTFCFINQSSASNKAYVTDTLRITLRTGPSIENKITDFLSSGQSLDIVATQGNWCRVKVLENGEIKNEGWILKQYVIDRMPYKTQADTLMNENRGLKDKLALVSEQINAIQKQREDLSILYQESQKELDKLKEDFNSLKQGSSDYLMLKAEFEAAQFKLKSEEKRSEKLYAENVKLKNSQRNIWFATGAFVLLCGLLIGFIIGRQYRKRKSLYY